MHIDWSTLAEVAIVAAAAALTVVLLVAFAVVGWSSRGRTVDGPAGALPSGVHPRVGTAVAVLCVLAAGLIVGYALLLIIA
jgi:hypothetical protein